MIFVWRYQKSILYYELLKPSETVDAHRYQEQLVNLTKHCSKNGQNRTQDFTV